MPRTQCDVYIWQANVQVHTLTPYIQKLSTIKTMAMVISVIYYCGCSQVVSKTTLAYSTFIKDIAFFIVLINMLHQPCNIVEKSLLPCYEMMHWLKLNISHLEVN